MTVCIVCTHHDDKTTFLWYKHCELVYMPRVEVYCHWLTEKVKQNIIYASAAMIYIASMFHDHWYRLSRSMYYELTFKSKHLVVNSTEQSNLYQIPHILILIRDDGLLFEA